MNQDKTEEDDITPEAAAEAAAEPSDATIAELELGALGSSLAASSAGSLAGGAFGTPGGPAAGAVILGILTGQEDTEAEVNPPHAHEENA